MIKMKILVTMLVIAHGQTSLSGASQPCKALPWRTWLLGFVQARERGEAPRRPGIEREICPESCFFFYFCAKDKQEVSRGTWASLGLSFRDAKSDLI